MTKLLLIGVAGALGAMTRMGLEEWVLPVSKIPMNTLVINLVGTFILCYLVTGAFVKLKVRKEFQEMITVGFLGSFTTFSALSIETILLLENGQGFLAMLYISMSIIGGLSAGILGNTLGRKLVKS